VPIIVFSIDADLKVKTNTKVIYSVKLLKTIKEFTVETITDQQKEEIYSKLLVLNVRDKEARTQHVEGIHKKKAEVANQIGANSCSKCGGELITERVNMEISKGAEIIRSVGLQLILRK